MLTPDQAMSPLVMATSMPNRSRLLHPDRLLLVAALAFVLLTNTPLFSGYWFPPHDSLYRSQVFYYFYNGVFQNGELPRWIPLGGYGYPAQYAQWAGLSPLAYFTGLLGWLAGVQDALWLFHVATLLDLTVFALGLVVLGRYLFHSFWLRATLVAGGLVGHFWWVQPYFQLYAIYTWPLVGYFLLRWTDHRQPGDLLAAMAIGSLSLVGNLPYIAPIHFWSFVLFTAINIRNWPLMLRSLAGLRQRHHLPALILVVGLAALLFHFALGSLSHIENLSGRDLTTHRTSLDNFLNYGRYDVGDIAISLLTGAFPHDDRGFYFGLLPIPLVILGLWQSRNRRFFAFAGVGLFLFGLSLGGLFSMAVYHLPGMGYFRHLSYLYPLIRLAWLWAAGLFVQELLSRHPPPPLTISRAMAVIALLLLLVLDSGWSTPATSLFQEMEDGDLWADVLLVRLSGYLAALLAAAWLMRNQRLTAACQVLAVAFILDLAGFHTLGWLQKPISNQPIPAALFQTSAMAFPAQRLLHDDPASTDRARLFFSSLPPSPIKPYYLYHAITYAMVGLDPCLPLLRNEILAKGVLAMIQARGGQPDQFPTSTYLPLQDTAFLALLGCHDQKLRWFRHTRWAADREQATALFRDLADPTRLLILEESNPNQPPMPSRAIQEEVQAQTLVQSFSPNHLALQVHLAGPSPAWLLYADAWHPNWQAWIDGQPVPVYRGQVGFKAVAVPPGSHRVLFRYGAGIHESEGMALVLLGMLAGLAWLAGLVHTLRADGADPATNGS